LTKLVPLTYRDPSLNAESTPASFSLDSRAGKSTSKAYDSGFGLSGFGLKKERGIPGVESGGSVAWLATRYVLLRPWHPFSMG
jgi:hypothetical protein